VVTAPVQAVGPAGRYTINYRVLSEDGVVVTGAVRFTMTTAATSPPTPDSGGPAAPPDEGGFPAWAWIIGSILAAAVLAAGVQATRRRRDRTVVGDLAEPTEPADRAT
jgi:copper resistance protein C